MRIAPCIAAASIALVSLVAVAEDAWACGGLFCSGAASTQVNQAAERIIFAQHPDDRVTAVVQIMYDGPADRFGWLLPVAGIPSVGVSSDLAFTKLQSATNPDYQFTTRVEGTCKRREARRSQNNGSGNNGSNNAFGSDEEAGAKGGVMVVGRGQTGPYDYVVLQASVDEDGNVDTVLDWLDANNYAVTNVGPDLIAEYLEEGYNLLAVRLQKTSNSGSIRPIRMTYDGDHPMIPIKLTAVAANDDMGVLTWVLGPSRAVPVNYKALELNDALINWFNPGLNYNDVVTAAANEASGQGFVTEYADAVSNLGRLIWSEPEWNWWNNIRANYWQMSDEGLVRQTVIGSMWTDPNTFQTFPLDGIGDVVDATMPDLAADTRSQLPGCPECFLDRLQIPSDFDAGAWVTAVHDLMVEPMADTQELFDGASYVTRMYTTMSADEMTVDPSFDFNPDLGDVSNLHVAEQIIECSSEWYRSEAPYRMELPSGLVVRGRQNQPWPIQPGDMMPASLTVSEVGTSGDGTVVRDNYATVSQELQAHNDSVRQSLSTKGVGGGGGCSSGGLGRSAPLHEIMLALVGVFFARRRRSRYNGGER